MKTSPLGFNWLCLCHELLHVLTTANLRLFGLIQTLLMGSKTTMHDVALCIKFKLSNLAFPYIYQSRTGSEDWKQCWNSPDLLGSVDQYVRQRQYTWDKNQYNRFSLPLLCIDAFSELGSFPWATASAMARRCRVGAQKRAKSAAEECWSVWCRGTNFKIG